jgi:RNA exonuclease 1
MKDPALYTVSLEQMIENEYPIPSYMADVFQKPPGWVESPQAPAESLLAPEDTKPKLYAIDCEMASHLLLFASS